MQGGTCPRAAEMGSRKTFGRHHQRLLLVFLLSLFIISLSLQKRQLSEVLLYSDLQKPMQKQSEELIQVYRIHEHWDGQEPPQLHPIHVKNDLIKLFDGDDKTWKLLPIDLTHRQGLVHTGAWMHILDVDGNVLILKRGPQLVTCPNAWGLVGEHTWGIEEPYDTVKRGISEELGPRVWPLVTNVQLLAPEPRYYVRDYGSSNGGRIDRQATYLWCLRLGVTHEKVPLQVDDEVAEFRWVSLAELERMILHDEGQETLELSDNRMKEDDNGQFFFCHETIVKLMHLGLDLLLQDKSLST